ncbi:unnamed protein product [Penicillium salamii]|nr:unnamed protein product [Penicillium salamii]
MTNALASEPKRPRPILRIFAVLVAVAAMSDLELCGTTRAGYTILSFVDIPGIWSLINVTLCFIKRPVHPGIQISVDLIFTADLGFFSEPSA